MTGPPNNHDRLIRALLAGAVIIATVVAVVLALTAEVPDVLPGIALGSQSLYREELGVAHLLGFYLVILLVALAAHGKVPVKFGKDGAEFGDIGRKLDAQDEWGEGLAEALNEVERMARGNRRAVEAVWRALADIAREDAVRLEALEKRLERFEKKGGSNGDEDGIDGDE
jgi:hypothetical protein